MAETNSVQLVNLSIGEKARGAFIGAAVGDALGWPQEFRGSRIGSVSGSIGDSATIPFRSWTRRSGGRFSPYNETILPGEYSDDTQLLLCTARSVLLGRQWFSHFVGRELPTWSIYERGGGGATKRAIGIWVSGRAPWSNDLDTEKRRQYFQAGGNGVAMRIMPHVLWGSRAEDFSSIARAIYLNGICTHGHPRALVGALAYGYALLQAFRQTRTLSYGLLLELAISNSGIWSKLPQFDGALSEWRAAADLIQDGDFDDLWNSTVREMTDLLQIGRKGIAQGALCIDHEILSDMGCFDRKVNSSGTITAAASIFLASRYAPDPLHGLWEAAFAEGADTDTIASMTGCILGAVTGTEWVEAYRKQLQDELYLSEIAQRVTQTDYVPNWDEGLHVPITAPRDELSRAVSQLETLRPGGELNLPDGRAAQLVAEPIAISGKNTQGASWVLKTSDGQTLHIKKVSKNLTEESKRPDFLLETKTYAKELPKTYSTKVKAVKLPVKDMDKARFFYGEVLGLKIARQSRKLVNFGGLIALVPADYQRDIENQPGITSNLRTILCVETNVLEQCYRRAQEATVILTPITERHRRRFFRCLDPDQNLVEVFERSRASSKTGSKPNSQEI